MVMASKNSCTPPGTPVEVTFARRKNANAITISAAMAVEMIVSPLKVIPKRCQTGSCSPTWIAAPSARRVSVIAVSSILRFCIQDVQTIGPDLLQHRQAGAYHQQCLEYRQSEQHTEPAM